MNKGNSKNVAVRLKGDDLILQDILGREKRVIGSTLPLTLNTSIFNTPPNHSIAQIKCGVNPQAPTSILGVHSIPLWTIANVKSDVYSTSKYRVKVRVSDILPRNLENCARMQCEQCHADEKIKCDCIASMKMCTNFSLLLNDDSGFLPVLVSG